MTQLIERDKVLTFLNIVQNDVSQLDNAINDIQSLPIQQSNEWIPVIKRFPEI